MKKYNILIISNIFIPLVLGLLIYTFLKTNKPQFLKIFPFISSSINNIYVNIDNIGINFIKYNLVDFLWAYSFSFYIFSLLDNKSLIVKFFLILLSLIITMGIEILQLFKILPGTFDLIDLVISAISVGVAFIIYNFLIK